MNMAFFNDICDAFVYLCSRSYMMWFFSLPVAAALVYLAIYVLSAKGERTK